MSPESVAAGGIPFRGQKRACGTLVESGAWGSGGVDEDIPGEWADLGSREWTKTRSGGEAPPRNGWGDREDK